MATPSTHFMTIQNVLNFRSSPWWVACPLPGPQTGLSGEALGPAAPGLRVLLFHPFHVARKHGLCWAWTPCSWPQWKLQGPPIGRKRWAFRATVRVCPGRATPAKVTSTTAMSTWYLCCHRAPSSTGRMLVLFLVKLIRQGQSSGRTPRPRLDHLGLQCQRHGRRWCPRQPQGRAPGPWLDVEGVPCLGLHAVISW